MKIIDQGINFVFMPGDSINFTYGTFKKSNIRLLEDVFVYAEIDSQCEFRLEMKIAKPGEEYKNFPGSPWVFSHFLVKNDALNLYFADIDISIDKNIILVFKLTRTDKNPTEIFMVQDPGWI